MGRRNELKHGGWVAIFLTGVTGFLGSYLAADLLAGSQETLTVLVRSRTVEEAEQRLWRALQLHMDFPTFWDYRSRRLDICLGDITQPGLGLSEADRARVFSSVDSIIHAAASLNRKSEEVCANVNLRGTLEVLQLAREIHRQRPLRRFSLISTIAVAGLRNHETVTEEAAIRWNRPDLDPYGRTKKMAETMATRLLEDIPLTVFRPSAVIGDTRFAPTTQFDMVRAFAWLGKFRVLPLNPDWRIDIVPADFVSRAIATIHQKEKPLHSIYHLSAGQGAVNYRQIATALSVGGKQKIFVPRLCDFFMSSCERLANSHRKWKAVKAATLVQVFKPHLLADTVFDNAKIVRELGETPRPFTEYASALLQFAREQNFKYPYLPFPGKPLKREVA